MGKFNILSYSSYRGHYNTNNMNKLLLEFCEYDFKSEFRRETTYNNSNLVIKFKKLYFIRSIFFNNFTTCGKRRYAMEGICVFVQFFYRSSTRYAKTVLTFKGNGLVDCYSCNPIQIKKIAEDTILDDFLINNIRIETIDSFLKDRTKKNNFINRVSFHLNHLTWEDLELFKEMVSDDRYIRYFIDEFTKFANVHIEGRKRGHNK